jgi:hypothetical protein
MKRPSKASRTQKPRVSASNRRTAEWKMMPRYVWVSESPVGGQSNEKLEGTIQHVFGQFDRKDWESFLRLQAAKRKGPGPSPEPITTERVHAVGTAFMCAVNGRKPQNTFLYKLPAQFWPNDTTERQQDYFRTFMRKQRKAIAEYLSMFGVRYSDGKITF